MNAKISVFVIYVETIIYLLLYNLHDCTFNGWNKSDPDIQSSSPEGVFCNALLNFIRSTTIKTFCLVVALVVYQINSNKKK